MGELARFPVGNFNLIESARRGVSPEKIGQVAALLGFSKMEMARILHVSRGRLSVSASPKPLAIGLYEKLLPLEHLAERGKEVFDDMPKFRLWLRRPCMALGGEVPFELLATATGFQIVLNELGKIEHGIFA